MQFRIILPSAGHLPAEAIRRGSGDRLQSAARTSSVLVCAVMRLLSSVKNGFAANDASARHHLERQFRCAPTSPASTARSSALARRGATKKLLTGVQHAANGERRGQLDGWLPALFGQRARSDEPSG